MIEVGEAVTLQLCTKGTSHPVYLMIFNASLKKKERTRIGTQEQGLLKVFNLGKLSRITVVVILRIQQKETTFIIHITSDTARGMTWCVYYYRQLYKED